MSVGPLIPGIRPGVKPPQARITENVFRETFREKCVLHPGEKPTETHGIPRSWILYFVFPPVKNPRKHTHTHKQTNTNTNTNTNT